MREQKTWLAIASILIGLIFLSGFGSGAPKTSGVGRGDSISHYLTLLKWGTPQQKAAAAYQLGQQHSSEAEVVNALADLLGNKTAIDATRYRLAIKEEKPTLGEEAAAALVQIGRPSIPLLIHVLKTSPVVEARKNAAWALGALHQASAAPGPVAA